ncbi:unnamed protein product, partial [Adineta steineri]
MAVDQNLPIVTPSTISSSSASSPILLRKSRALIATNNSSAFIQFPNSPRRSSSFIPIPRPQASPLSTPVSSIRTNAQSISNAPSSSTVSDEHKRTHSQHGSNPILNNPLLNHRKEKPKPFRQNFSTDISYTTKLNPSGKQLSNNNQPENINNQQQMSYFDKT